MKMVLYKTYVSRQAQKQIVTNANGTVDIAFSRGIHRPNCKQLPFKKLHSPALTHTHIHIHITK